MKKLFALALVLLMVLSLGAGALAAGDGSITITNATIGKDYAIYKVFDATYSGRNVAYTYTKTGETDALFAILSGTGSPFELTASTVANVYNVTVRAGKDAAAISTFLTANKTYLTQTAAATAATETVAFTGLDYGYYYITSALGAVVTIDTAAPSAEVVDKNQGSNWDLSGHGKAIMVVGAGGQEELVEINSANYGDELTFRIGVNAVNYEKGKQVLQYVINDTMAAGLSFVEGSLKVTVDGKTLGAADYTLTPAGQSFKVSIPWATGSAEAGYTPKYSANAVIIVEYKATVTADAAIAGEGNKNTATYDYQTVDDKPDGPWHESKTEETTTYVFALGILKTDEKGSPLAGAKFALTDEAGHPIYVTAADDSGTYVFDAQSKSNEVVSPASGLIVIKGLAAGTYKLTETEAPRGYNLLENVITVEASIESVKNYTTTITTYYDKDGNVVSQEVAGGSSKTTTAAVNVVPVTVVNKAGTELPSTGGIGTTLFYVLGGLLVVGAVILFVTRKRMKSEG